MVFLRAEAPNKHGVLGKVEHGEGCSCPRCQSWDDYDNSYIDFALEYSRQMMCYTLATELLTNFPMRLPKNIIGPIMAKRYEILTKEMERRGQPVDKVVPNWFPDMDPIDEAVEQAAEERFTLSRHRIRCAFEGLYGLARFGKKMPEMEFPQFDRFLVSQNVVVVCGFAEGFIANTIKKLCEARPEPLMGWKRRAKRINDLSDAQILDRYNYELGFGAMDQRLKRIEDEFGIEFPVSERQRRKVSELYLIRNCIVHNAGLVSRQYKDRGDWRDEVDIGSEIPLPAEPIEELLDTLVDLVIAIYRSVSVDVLGKSTSQLMYGAYRNIPSE